MLGITTYIGSVLYSSPALFLTVNAILSQLMHLLPSAFWRGLNSHSFEAKEGVV